MQFPKNKNVILLIIIIALVLIGWGLMEDRNLNDEERFPKINFHPNKISRIELITEDSRTVLVLKDAVWVVLEDNVTFPSDSESVQSLIDTLSNFSLAEVVSKNTDKYASFSVDQAQATVVQWYEGGDNLRGTLYVGQSDFGRGGDFVRIDDWVPVYISSTHLFAISSKDFKDMKVVSFIPEEIDTITWQYGGESKETFTLEQRSVQAEAGGEAKEWFLGETQINKDLIQPVLSAFSSLSAQEVKRVEQGRDYGFSNPTFVVSVVVKGMPTLMTFGSPAEEMPAYYVSVSGKDEWMYFVHAAAVNDQLQKKQADFLAPRETKEESL